MEFEDSFNRLRVVVKLRQPSDQLFLEEKQQNRREKVSLPNFFKKQNFFHVGTLTQSWLL